MMFDFLKQPYPVNDDFWRQLKTAFFISLFVTAFLLIFQPFGLSNPGVSEKPLIIAGYGVTCFLVMMVLFALLRLIKARYSDNWTTGREIIEILVYIFFIGISNLLYTHFIFGTPVSVRTLLIFELITLLIGLFPATALVVINQINLLSKNTRQAEDFNRAIAVQPSIVSQGAIRFLAENEKDGVDTDEDNFLFIEAADNYCTVYYLEDGVVRSQMLRTTLKRLEQQAGRGFIMRCHRTYLVNLRKVVSVSGSAQGYKLRFEGFDQAIPVSRNLNSQLRTQLSQLGQ